MTEDDQGDDDEKASGWTDMAYTEDDIKALEREIASGHQSVSYKDRTVQYRSLSEMKEVLADMRADVEGKKRNRRTNPTYDSGL